MKQLEKMKETLISATQAQLVNLSAADTKELGCAIDMIKDLAEAIYYCSMVKEKEEPAPLMYYYEYPRGRQEEYYNPQEYQRQQQKYRQPQEYGRSPERRRTYMESHNMKDKSTNMKELDKYVQELAGDVLEMVQEATQDEKQMLGKKLNMLASKLQEE